MSKTLLLIISLTVILITAALVYYQNYEPDKYKPGVRVEFDTAINQAKHIYQLKKQGGEDLQNGPCLSNALMPGWVVDLVHDPRQPIDDRPENQCSAFLEGKAKHFVELDLEGNFIRAR